MVPGWKRNTDSENPEKKNQPRGWSRGNTSEKKKKPDRGGELTRIGLIGE